MEKTQILNDKGEPVVLNAQERSRANVLQAQYNNELRNTLGYEVDITTLTTISKRVVEQKFFTIPFADYMPVRVGEGAWASEILTYRDYAIGGDFGTGVVNTGNAKSRLAEVDSAINSIKVPILNWAKQINWTFMDLQIASRSGNWDIVTSKEKSRKKNWDLGIQKIAFLGMEGYAETNGLLTQSDVTANTSVITKYIKSMTAAEFDTFVQNVVSAYRTNAVNTAYPTHFIIPETDYVGLAAPVSATYPNVTKLEYLTRAFQMVTMNPNFKILPVAYADQANNADITGLNKNRYTLLNYDEDTIRMDIPVDYTATLQNTINGFNFENVGYGQFTGVKAYRPREVIYFDFT
ncbi:major capsid family protein [uncultured Paraglaciecola sp.]|uniref:major capsid family protein n=1 Tax=uncultured Paraglaciecola sp. TaxID=1765024 RepID=UPI00260B779F|nr:major capsid family protein [uncultured Paraglaciecola sp.]